MLKIGASVEIGTGVIQSLCGLIKTIKKFNASDQSNNFDKSAKLIKVYKLRTYIEKTLINLS